MAEDYGFYDFDYAELLPEGFEKLPPRDVKIDDAKKDIKKYFEERKEAVCHLRQIEVFFEKLYFHWITIKAVSELVDQGYLKEQWRNIIQPGTLNLKLKFVYHRSNRYFRREIDRKLKIISKYCDPPLTHAIGEQAELLFLKAFALNGFRMLGAKVREFRGKKWDKSDRDLDFVMEKDGIIYGCEVKNKLGYINQDEMREKIEMCQWLGLKPVFIMRNAPKNYMFEIYKAGGFGLLFDAQVYPLGYNDLVKEIKEKMDLPVVCSRSIPDGIIQRFIVKYHKKHVNSK